MSAPAPSVANPDNVAQPVAAATSNASAPGDGARFWRALALVFALLWMLTIGWLLLARRRSSIRQVPPEQDVDSAPRQSFRDACRRNDYAAAGRALLAWARQARPQLRNLGELRACIEEPAQRAAIEALERCRYGGADAAADLGQTLAQAFRDKPLLAVAEEPHRPGVLPALYPFRT